MMEVESSFRSMIVGGVLVFDEAFCFMGTAVCVGGFFVPCRSVIYGMLEVVLVPVAGNHFASCVSGVRGSCSTELRVRGHTIVAWARYSRPRRVVRCMVLMT